MNFFIVFCRTRRKFDKYVKINRIRNKVIVDIDELQIEYDYGTSTFDKDYFNLMVYAKISHALKKGKDVYYIPDFNVELSINQLFKLRELLNIDISFNALVFYDEFIKTPKILDEIHNNLHNFNVSQIIKDY